MSAARDVLLHHVGGGDLDPRALIDAWTSDGAAPRDARTVLLSWAAGDREAVEAAARALSEADAALDVVVLPEPASSPAEHLRRRVIPIVERLRADVIAEGRSAWRDRFSLTLSFGHADAVWVSALLAATRSLRPTLILSEHGRLCRRAFGEVEHIPPAPPSAYDDPEVARIVAEMCRWRDEYLSATRRARGAGEDELYDFWLRKGRRSVLAVLLVDDGSGPAFFRGCNLEVSLPTGTLCAERNAIGTALASRPDLKRHHVRMVAVLSLGGPGETDGTGGNPIGPCGACREWLLKIDEVNPDLKVVTFTDRACAHVIVQSLGQVP